jgi:hypothetical protein
MDMLSISVVSLFISANILFFIVGYLSSSILNKNSLSINTISGKQSNTNKIIKNTIDIDSKKIVTNIRTDNLEKKYENIAESSTSNENISSSISKLKNIKG